MISSGWGWGTETGLAISRYLVRKARTGAPRRAEVRLARGEVGVYRRDEHGYGRGDRMKIERDEARLTGLRGGETLGRPDRQRLVCRTTALGSTLSTQLPRERDGSSGSLCGPQFLDLSALGSRERSDGVHVATLIPHRRATLGADRASPA